MRKEIEAAYDELDLYIGAESRKIADHSHCTKEGYDHRNARCKSKVSLTKDAIRMLVYGALNKTREIASREAQLDREEQEMPVIRS